MRTPRISVVVQAAAVLTALWLGLAGAAFSQGNGLVQVSSGFPLTAAALQARVDAAKTAGGIPEELRAEIVQQYQQALDSLAIADASTVRASELAVVAAAAPKELTAARGRLEHPEKVIGEPLSADASVEVVRQRLATRQSELNEARDRAARLGEEIAAGAVRRTELPGNLTSAKQELVKATAAAEADAPTTAQDELAVARRAAQLAAREAAQARVRVLEAELQSYEARVELLPAQRQLAMLEISILEDRVGVLQARADAMRKVEAERAARSIAEKRDRIIDAYPQLRDLAEATTSLARRRTSGDGIADEIESAKMALQGVQRRADELAQRERSVREKARAVGFTQLIGLILQRERKELEDVTRLERNISARRIEIGQVQVELLDLDAARDQLADLEDAVQSTIRELPAPTIEPSEALNDAVAELLSAQRNALDALLTDYNTYFVTLVDLDAAERGLVDQTRDYKRFINENILWVRGGQPLAFATLRDAGEALAWLFAPENLTGLLWNVSAYLRVQPLLSIVALTAWSLLLFYRRRIRADVEALYESDKQKELTFRASATALVATAIVALPWPMLLFLLSAPCSGIEATRTEFTRSVGAALLRVATVAYFLEFLRQVCRTPGLGSTYFHWPERSLVVARRYLGILLFAGIPLSFFAAILDEQESQSRAASLGLALFVTMMLLVAVVVRRIFHPDSGILRSGSTGRFEWSGRLRASLPTVAPALPVVLALLALIGYQAAAVRLGLGLLRTVWLSLVLWIMNIIASRWLLHARRELAIAEARRRLAAARLKKAATAADAGADKVAVEEPEVDLATIDTQTRRLLTSVIALGLLVGLWLVWRDVLPALGVLDRLELWSTTRDDGTLIPVTAGDLLAAAIIAAMTVGASRNIPGALEITILQRLPLEPGVRYAARTVARYLIVLVGFLLIAGALGLAWSKVQWLAAAVTVGLGFGLQEIFANFVSGLIMLFERPVRVGDTVTLGSVSGTVARISMRATTIVDWDRRELIVPNKEFITGQLINWTLSDPILRLVVPVGIAYGSDTDLAEKVLLRVASECELVRSDPAPTVLFSTFGESSLDFQLRVFLPSIENYWRAIHALHMAIDREFRKAGIEIAFPQRDLHLRSVSSAFPVIVRETE